MTYRGHIRNGAVVLDEPVRTPGGSQVLIHSVQSPAQSTFATAPLADLLRDVPGQRNPLPPAEEKNRRDR